MAGRTLISYDDIVPPGLSQMSPPAAQSQPAPPPNMQREPPPHHGNAGQSDFDSNFNGPPSKKRKRNNNNGNNHSNNRNRNQKFGNGHQNGAPGGRGRGRGNGFGPQESRQGQGHAHGHTAAVQHWDDPGQADASMPYEESKNGMAEGDEEEFTTVILEEDGEGEWDEDGEHYDMEMAMGAEEEEEEVESRELTHTEIWDDSALIDAWESATAEYEVRTTPTLDRRNASLTAPFPGFPRQRKIVER